MERCCKGSARSGVLFGVLLIVAGSILLAERMRLMPTGFMGHFWPAVWLLIGTGLLVSNRGAIGKAWGLFLVLVGLGMEAGKFGLIRFRVWDMWPVWIIALGIFLLWRALRPPDPKRSSTEIGTSRISEFAMFGGGDVRVTSQHFEGGNLTAVFGGHEVDFHSARINGDGPAVLYADAVFGGVSLRVPPAWTVSVDGPAIFGGIENKTLTPQEGGEGQHLVVKAMAVFGGVEVKN